MVHSKATKTTPSRKLTTYKRTCKRGERKMTGTQPTSSSSSPKILDCLPPEIIAEVVAHVASSSFADLVRCKLSCKALLDITKEKQVLQRASLEGLPFFLWLPTQHAESFFKRCQESQNPEALFQLGMWQYFSCVMVEEGIANLEKAAVQGHMVATYVLGLVFLCMGDLEERERGVSLVMNILERFKGKGIVECRKKLRKATRTMWMNNNLIQQTGKPRFSCAMEEQHGGVRHGWRELYNYDEEWEDRVVCQTCRCRRELDFFFKLLPTA